MSAPAQQHHEAPRAPLVERHPQDGWCLADPVPLSRASERALQTVVWALLPPAPAPRPADIEARVARQVRRMMQYMPAALRLGFVLLLHALFWSPIWRFRALSRLSKLTHTEASYTLACVAQSRLMPLRLMMLAPKAIVLSAYFDQDEIHAALDYEPRAFIRERTERRMALLEELTSLDQTGTRRKLSLEVLS